MFVKLAATAPVLIEVGETAMVSLPDVPVTEEVLVPPPPLMVTVGEIYEVEND